MQILGTLVVCYYIKRWRKQVAYFKSNDGSKDYWPITISDKFSAILNEATNPYKRIGKNHSK